METGSPGNGGGRGVILLMGKKGRNLRVKKVHERG
jgi:hypothetical protein